MSDGPPLPRAGPDLRGGVGRRSRTRPRAASSPIWRRASWSTWPGRTAGATPRPSWGGSTRWPARPKGCAPLQRRVLPLVELRADFSVSREELDDADRGRRRHRAARARRSGAPDRRSPRTRRSSTATRLRDTRHHRGELAPRRSPSRRTWRSTRGWWPRRSTSCADPASAAPTGSPSAPSHLHRDRRDDRARRPPALRPPPPDPRRAPSSGRRGSRAEWCSASAAATSSSTAARTSPSAISHHDAEVVRLYVEESLSFRCHEPDAAVALRRAG